MKLLLILSFIFTFCLIGYGQTVELKPDEVVVKKDFVDDATKAFDLVVALRSEIVVKDKANEDLKAELTDWKIKFVKTDTERSMLMQQAIRDNALINFLVPRTRKKCIGLCAQFGQ